MDDELDRIVIYPSRLKGFAAFLGAIMFVGLGIAFAQFRKELGIKFGTAFITSFVGIPFFGACALYVLYRILVRRPSLVVDKQGILDNTSALAVGFLAWDEIERVASYNYMGQEMLGIFPKDLPTVLARQNRFKRYLLGLNRNLGCAPINISQVTLSLSINELFMMIEKRLGATSRHDAEGNGENATPSDSFQVILTVQEITCEHPKRKRESVRWDEVVRIWYITTSDGPWISDEWLLFEGKSEGCMVPTEAQGFDKIWDEIKFRFSGFDYRPMIQGGTDDAKYLCWQKPSEHP